MKVDRHKKVLITGSRGLLGLSLMKNKPDGFDCYGEYFDVRAKDTVLGIFKALAPDVVIHTASLGNVDYCEKNRQEAWETNVEGSRNMIEASKQAGARLIFMSSNAVFDGTSPPYKEEDKTNPLDYYGATKLQTEIDIAAGGIRYAIARLMTMYGWNHPLERQNPVTWVLERLKKEQKISVVDDIYNNHLFVDNAAHAIWAIITKEKQGIYHLAGSQTVSRYELACEVADIFGLDKKLITPVSSSFFPALAPRPKNTSYAIAKMERELSVPGIGIREGLSLMKANPPKDWTYDWL